MLNIGRDVKQQKTLMHLIGEHKLVQSLWKIIGHFFGEVDRIHTLQPCKST